MDRGAWQATVQGSLQSMSWTLLAHIMHRCTSNKQHTHTDPNIRGLDARGNSAKLIEVGQHFLKPHTLKSLNNNGKLLNLIISK